MLCALSLSFSLYVTIPFSIDRFGRFDKCYQVSIFLLKYERNTKWLHTWGWLFSNRYQIVPYFYIRADDKMMCLCAGYPVSLCIWVCVCAWKLPYHFSGSSNLSFSPLIGLMNASEYRFHITHPKCKSTPLLIFHELYMLLYPPENKRWMTELECFMVWASNTSVCKIFHIFFSLRFMNFYEFFNPNRSTLDNAMDFCSAIFFFPPFSRYRIQSLSVYLSLSLTSDFHVKESLCPFHTHNSFFSLLFLQ